MSQNSKAFKKQAIAYFKKSSEEPKQALEGFVKHIQAYGPEGAQDAVLLASLLTGQAINTSFPGTINGFKTYASQIAGIYRKYNGMDDFGNQQTRAVIDLRTAFISGEGLNISADNPGTAKWIQEFIRKNKLNGVNLVNMVKGSEMSGQCLARIKLGPEGKRPEVIRIPCSPFTPFKPVYEDDTTKDKIKAIVVKKRGTAGETTIADKDFVYCRTGGDDFNTYDPTPRVGIVLTDLENYDRAIKDMRRLNHITARVTPTFKAEKAEEVKTINALLESTKWKMGEAVVSTAEFDYKVPATGAHQNLIYEVTTTLKTISSVTGCPVHWLGYVDLMSNRATAEELYKSLKNATSNERLIFEAFFYDLILKAMELEIDKGGNTDIKLDYNFSVSLPLLDFANFKERVEALAIGYSQKVISMSDFRNGFPGIDPIQTARDIAAEDKEVFTNMKTKINIEETKDDERQTGNS